ncbi:MAG: phosphoglycerate mutase family protein [Bacteroidota bacterium]
MKKIFTFIVLAVCFAIAMPGAYAQTSTYILLRHAEKDTSVAGSSAMKADPPLSKEGELRAQKLLAVLKDYVPDMIYSTNYTRTRSTVAPLAVKFNKEVKLYDPRNLAVFAEQLLQERGKTIIVVGHSNTTPALVNLLTKENTYKDLEDSVYNQLWIVTVSEGKMVTKVVVY